MSRPNILFVTTDHQRADTIFMNQCGVEVTPRLNRLCGDSCVFTRAYTTTPLCVPARTALATGTYPTVNGIVLNDLRRPGADRHVPVHQYLAEAGYRVAHSGIQHIHVHPALTDRVPFERFVTVRGDDSSYHTFYFDPETGRPLRGATHQGYQDGSTWTRGQAWGIYGFALSCRYTNHPAYLETSRRMANYFYRHLPEDEVAYWDFDAPVDADTWRDSSASAIAAAGTLELLELLERLAPEHSDRAFLEEAVFRSMKSLVENYSTMGEPEAQGLLKRGSANVNKLVSPDDFVIWGDYFYLEALLRMEQGLKGYWYE